MEIAIFALGCFWGPEKKFSRVNGVVKTEVGYCGGKNIPVTYREVCTGQTNHAEVVRIEFDPSEVAYEYLVEKFFEFHDPTTLNSQGPDFGTQYRSEIFYTNEDQKKTAEKVFDNTNRKLSGKVVTKISILHNYFRAEEYHQKYLEK